MKKIRMSCIKSKIYFSIYLIFMLIAGIVLLSPAAEAKKKNQVASGMEAGETGAESAAEDAKGNDRDVRLHNKDNIIPADYDREYFHVGDHGFLTFAKDAALEDYSGAPSDVRQNIAEISSVDDFADETIVYSVDDNDVLTINESRHTYRILAGGETSVIMTMKARVPDEAYPDGYREETWLAKFTFIVMGDASGVLPDSELITTYMVYDSTGEADIELLNCPNLRYYSFDYISSNADMAVRVDFDPWTQMVHIESEVEGITLITLLLNGTPIPVTYDNRMTTISADHYVMDVGDTMPLTIDQYSGRIRWHTTNKDVASVSKTGLVTGLSVGNAVIYARIGDSRIGCAVSVVPAGHSEVVAAAEEIGDTRFYSQEFRMSPGYYDCSSLVWMAYTRIGKYFGLKTYAPTAASEAKWCADKERMLGEWTWGQFYDMEYLPGDLLFRVGADNGRYLGIYHVEMFAGYRVKGFDEYGEPVLSMCWANRPDDYYEPCGDLFARP